ncbi:MAG: hypothetical protein JKY54_07990 [Flavobacteriales bacterium]|nr:hypothetical protein [Flavobacteriales bacterium]
MPGIGFGQEIESILNQAKKFEVQGNLEQARYYYSIALEKDSLNTYKIAHKLFEIDSIFLFNSDFKLDISKMQKGDSAYFSENHPLALKWYGSASRIAYQYVDYRVNQILEKEPELRMKWVILLSKRVSTINQSDSLYNKYQEDSNYRPIQYNWRLIDSTRYADTIQALIEEKEWPMALHIVHQHVLKHGFKPLFQKDIKRLHELRMKQLKSQERSFRLKAEQIEQQEAKESPDLERIKSILNKVNPELIEDSELRNHFILLMKKYNVETPK